METRKTTRDKLASNLIKAILEYATEIDYDERELIMTLMDMDITYDDFVRSGYGDYGVMRECYEIDDDDYLPFH